MSYLLDSLDVSQSVVDSTKNNESTITTSNDTSYEYILKNKEESNTTTAEAAHSTMVFADIFNEPWVNGLAVVIFLLLIFITVIGNTLVILAVLTTRRLRTVTNCFVMNLAVADWLVGMFVMPPAVVLYIVGNWKFGWILCDIWISLDVLLCTASILSLCAISLDRYLAITQPLTYSKRRRSKRLALLIIIVVWLAAITITCPPFFGWYEAAGGKDDLTDCQYNENKGYVIFSAMGSFFIPLAVMMYVYMRIGCVLWSRRHRITQTEATEKSRNVEPDNCTSETDTLHNNSIRSKFYSKFEKNNFEKRLSQNTLYELIEVSKSAPAARCSTMPCKYDSGNVRSSVGASNFADRGSNPDGAKPIESIQFCENSASESSLMTGKIKANQAKCYRVPMRISTLKRESKAGKTLTIVMGGFIVCWLPFFIYYIITPFLPKESVNFFLKSFLTWLGWISSAINPFIYAFYNVDFRAAFWRLTIGRLSRKQSNSLVFRN